MWWWLGPTLYIVVGLFLGPLIWLWASRLLSFGIDGHWPVSQYNEMRFDKVNTTDKCFWVIAWPAGFTLLGAGVTIATIRVVIAILLKIGMCLAGQNGENSPKK